jgi:hypothetical protein
VCRFDAGSAGVLTECDIPDVVAAIFDRPMPPDRLAERLGAEGDLADIEGDVLGFVPEAGLCILVPGQAADAGSMDDQAVPFGVEPGPNVEGLNLAGFMAAVASGIDAFEALGRRLGGGDILKPGQQGWLIGLDRGEQSVAAVARRLKGFFDSEGRRR